MNKLTQYRLSQAEYDQICSRLGRAPEGVEWAVFSALWSEHCSYKSSKVHIKKFFNKSSRVLESFGENAGVVDLGLGERVAFKMESHNHPSFIEPFQGAATGVGGILRDVFTMGARPIALANYLCFGEPTAERMPALVDGVVRGISSYGNCVGVPNISGQTEFHSSYNKNILVNAFALGFFGPSDRIVTSRAQGVGNAVVYVGAKTGRDGVHGASMASEAFDQNSEKKRPNVQIGDPFFEKLLIESCLEVIQSGRVIAIQDMGAAGLTSSSFEMAAKGEVGFRLQLDKVPLRDSTMTPEEILLSESQERMLLICMPGNFQYIADIFSKWGLDASIIGEVTEGRQVELFWHGDKIASLDPRLVVDSAPVYERPYQPWKSPKKLNSLPDDSAAPTPQKFLSNIETTSREWIFEQYDQRVLAQTVRDCRSPVGVLRLPSGRGLGVALGCRPDLMRMDARVGAIDSILRPALSLAAMGFMPLAATDCLNFGNPEKPEIMSEFVAAVEAMNEICKALDVPVISGNVSFYNETLGENITSTPATGLVGLRESILAIPQSIFTLVGSGVYLLCCPWIEALPDTGFVEKGDLSKLTDFVSLVTRISGHFESARVVGKGGVLGALARMSVEGIGARVRKLGPPGVEQFYQILFTASTADVEKISKQLSSQVTLFQIGETTADRLEVDGHSSSASELKTLYKQGWQDVFSDLA